MNRIFDSENKPLISKEKQKEIQDYLAFVENSGMLNIQNNVLMNCKFPEGKSMDYFNRIAIQNGLARILNR